MHQYPLGLEHSYNTEYYSAYHPTLQYEFSSIESMPMYYYTDYSLSDKYETTIRGRFVTVFAQKKNNRWIQLYASSKCWNSICFSYDVAPTTGPLYTITSFGTSSKLK